ncbi:MAG: nucleotidyltransferase family protein [Bacteroidales bacterium]|nr:nucleotidyltransferase family protein [Bacteroidales bacterium]
MDFSAVILAAGYSSRMGVPKWGLMFDDKLNFVEKISHEFAKTNCEQIVLVVNELSNSMIMDRGLNFPDKLRIVVNENPDLGKFYSLKKALKICNLEKPVCFTNVDNPFIDSQLIALLINESHTADYISPEYEGKGGHPVVISSTIVKAIRNSEENDINLKEFLSQFERKRIRVLDKKVSLNINTKLDYLKYFNQSV